MLITIKNLQKKITISPPKIKTLTQTILRLEKIKSADLSFVFVSAQRMIALNKKFLNRSYATDVLAFDLTDQTSPLSAPSKISHRFVVIGEIIISTDAVIKNSKQFKQSKKHELTLYVIHGILHLLGYDDHQPKDIKRMRAREQELFRKLKNK